MTDSTPAVPTSNAMGIASFVLGLISIFMLSIVTVPLAVIFGGFGLRHPQKVWAYLGLVCAVIGFMTSPILLGLVGYAST